MGSAGIVDNAIPMMAHVPPQKRRYFQNGRLGSASIEFLRGSFPDIRDGANIINGLF